MKMYILGLMLLGQGAMAELTPARVLGLNGKFSFDILNNADVSKAVRDALTSTFAARTSLSVRNQMMADFQKSMDVSVPATVVDGRFLVSTGCETNNCGDNRALFVIDAQIPTALLIVRKNVTSFDGRVEKEAVAVLTNGAWTLNNGSDLTGLSPNLQAAIKAR